MKKIFVVKKFVEAKSAKDALKKEKTCPVDEIWIDEEWKKNNISNTRKPMGFSK